MVFNLKSKIVSLYHFIITVAKLYPWMIIVNIPFHGGDELLPVALVTYLLQIYRPFHRQHVQRVVNFLHVGVG